MRNPGVFSSMAIALTAAVVGMLLLSPGLAAPAPATLADGTITAVDGSVVTIATRAGSQLRVVVGADTRVIQRKAARLEDIRRNDFVGVTARREPDGGLTAISINIFPPEFKTRIREAQFVMDTGNIMTNATVFQNVRRIEGRTLYLRMPEGAVVITVPRAAEVFKLTLITLADLKPGMRVQVRGTPNPDGSLLAATITVD